MGETLISIIPDMERKTVDEFVKKAVELDHPLLEKTVKPVRLVEIGRDAKGTAFPYQVNPSKKCPESFCAKVTASAWILVITMWAM